MNVRRIPISRLVLPGSFKRVYLVPRGEKYQDARVLGEWVREWGCLEPPVVQQSTWKALTGLDWIAGALLLGEVELTCIVVNVDDTDADVIRRIEMGKKKTPITNRQALMAELETEAKAVAEEALADPSILQTDGRPSTPKGVARARLAQRHGVTPNAIRQQEWRHKGGKPRKRSKTMVEPPTKLRSLGMPLDPDWLKKVARVQEQVSQAAAWAKASVGAMTRIESEELPFPSGVLAKLKSELQDLHALMRNSIPDCLCPYCKGIDEVQNQCGGCSGVGWISKAKAGNIPNDSPLWSEDERVVVFEGKQVSVYDFIARPGEGSEELHEQLEEMFKSDPPPAPAFAETAHIETEDWGF